ncbi:MAG: hypothetical protein SFV81_19150, partial [Pirellulaceae bacterium]|nr:hypothetical protein [Pirellulaceae bacterium]
SRGTDSYAEKLETPSAQNNSLSPKSDEADSSLIPNSSLSLTLDPLTPSETGLKEPGAKEPQLASKSEPEPHATASLNPPVVKPQEPLFKDSELTQSKSGLSAQPASTATQRSTTNNDKPALWDSSKTNVHDTNKPLTLEFSSDDTKLSGSTSAPAMEPSHETAGTSAKLISQSTADVTSGMAPSTSATLVPKGLQTAAKTVTPEMDQAELFAAYRELKAPTTPAKVDNRYGSASVAANQPQTGLLNGGQASVVGYVTQPNQTNQSLPTNNNYTLQPTQNFAPNVVPQYSTQSATFQNQPFQNPTYPAPQYSNQQYSGQPNSGQPNPALPQYSLQPQSGLQNPNSLATPGVTNQPSAGSQGLQFGGAQVPYSTQPTQGQALQLPPGPIGGYGNASSTQANKPNGGTTNLASPTSPSYPSLR